MKSFYFFSDFNSDLYLLEQSAVDAFGPISQAEFRVNSVHSANNDPTAYAIAAGKVLVQQSQNPDLLNILIKPFLSPTFLPEPVKYFVYRGVKKSSLVSSNALSLEETLLTDSDNDLLQTIVSFGTDEIFPAGLLGLGVDFSELDVDDILVGPQKGDWLYIRPTVKAGDKIGDFDKDHIGIEIILESGYHQFTLEILRGEDNIIGLQNLGGTTPETELYRKTFRQDQILSYYDPCHFFASLMANEVLNFKDDAKPDFISFVQNFYNRRYTYLDLKNEHNFSLNFYKSYSAEGDPKKDAEIQLATGDSNFATITYGTDGWPLHRVAIDSVNFDQLGLKLPVGDNKAGAFFLTQGQLFKSLIDSAQPLRSLPRVENNLGLDGNTGFTEEITLTVPQKEGIVVPAYLTLRYLRRMDDSVEPGGTGYRPAINNFRDNLFDISHLVGKEGLQFPPLVPPFQSAAYFNLNWVYVDPSGPAGQGYMAQFGIAQDQIGVYFLAIPPSDQLQDPQDPIVRSKEKLIWRDSNVDQMLPFTNLRKETVAVNGKPSNLPVGDNQQSTNRPSICIAVTWAEWAEIFEAYTIFSNPAAPTWQLGFKRIHLVKQEPFQINGQRVFTFELWICVNGMRDVFTYPVGQPSLPCFQPGSIKFYTRDSNASYLFSHNYLAQLDQYPDADPLEYNRKNLRNSVALKDSRITVREDPKVDLITQEEWEMDTPRHDEFELKSKQNAIGQISGQEKAPINILAKTEDQDKQTWYYIEFQEDTLLIKPLKIPSNYGFDRAPIPIRGNLTSKNKGTKGWIRKTDALPLVASFPKFMRNFKELLSELDEEYSSENLTDRLTRIRMLTKERYENTWSPQITGDEKEGVFSRMFDVVIGTIEESNIAFWDSIKPSITDPKGLETIEYEKSPDPRPQENGVSLDTHIQLFRDYMMVDFGNDFILNLHHLFVGLDVMNHEKQNRVITKERLLYAMDNFTDYGTIDDYFEESLYDNRHASLWAGDLGSVFTSIEHGTHASYETDWATDNPKGANESQEKYDQRKDTVFFEHYYHRQCSDKDLLTDILPYKLSEEIQKISKQPDKSSSDAIINSLHKLHYDLSPPNNVAEYFKVFRKDLKKGSKLDNIIDAKPGFFSSDTLRPTNRLDNVVFWIEDTIINFSKFFEIRQQVSDQGSLGIIWNDDQLNDETQPKIEATVKDKIAPKFIKWFQDRSGVPISDDD